MTIKVMPDDLFNRELVDKLHPSDWSNPDPQERYNLLVIGAGPAGLVAAAGAAGLGAKVALVERHLMGGDCLNYGCVPSKALLSAAKKIHYSGQSGKEEFGRIMEGLRKKRNDLADHDSAARFSDLDVDVFFGQGEFLSPECFEVAGAQLNFHRAVIATGARASLPPLAGLEESDPLTNETVFSLTELPERLVVIGAGPIGCELAQAFCRFGSEVTLVDIADRILPNEDPNASIILQKQLEKEGVTVILNANISQIDRTGQTKNISLKGAKENILLSADHILVAAGRIPNIEGLGLEAAKVDVHSKGIIVSDRLQTTSPRIFAAGDVCSRYQFTHSADAMAKIVIQNALFFGRKKANNLVMPWATYTSPEVAHVGITDTEAAQAGQDVVTYTVYMSENDRAILEEEDIGFARAHVDRKSGRILGATMVSSHAGEAISEMTLAITSGLKISDVGATIHPYPSQSEVWKKLATSHLKESFTPTIARIFKIFLGWFSRPKRGNA